jgi:hypothetical protein
LADQGQRTKFFALLSIYMQLYLFGVEGNSFKLLVFELYNRKKEGKKPENLTSKH